jgi:hypothetical protein
MGRRNTQLEPTLHWKKLKLLDELQRVLALVAMTHSITILPIELLTGIEILSVCASTPNI